MRHRIVAHPILAFVILAYGFSYLVGAPFLIAVQAWLPNLPEFVQLYLGRSLVVFGPAFAAAVVVSATSGRAGIFSLASRLRFRRSDLPWWLALPVLAICATCAGYLLAGVPPTVLAETVVRSWPLLLGHCLMQSIVVGIGEELGWRGWLLPALLHGRRRIVASSHLAAIWGLWHLPILLSGFRNAITFLVAVYALTFLLTALWSRTGGNLAVMALAHGSVNAPLFFFESVLGPELGQAAWSRTVLIYALGALLLLTVGWRWWCGRLPDLASDEYSATIRSPAAAGTARVG